MNTSRLHGFLCFLAMGACLDPLTKLEAGLSTSYGFGKRSRAHALVSCCFHFQVLQKSDPSTGFKSGIHTSGMKTQLSYVSCQNNSAWPALVSQDDVSTTDILPVDSARLHSGLWPLPDSAFLSHSTSKKPKCTGFNRCLIRGSFESAGKGGVFEVNQILDPVLEIRRGLSLAHFLRVTGARRRECSYIGTLSISACPYVALFGVNITYIVSKGKRYQASCQVESCVWLASPPDETPFPVGDRMWFPC